MKKKIIFQWLLLICWEIPVEGQIRGNSIQINVVPDHQDWCYEVGQTATFKISVTREHTLLYNISIDYEAGPEMYQAEKKCGVLWISFNPPMLRILAISSLLSLIFNKKRRYP